MFTFRSDVELDTDVSRFIDGEMLHHERDATSHRIETDEKAREEYNRFHQLSRLLSRPVPETIVADSSQRVHQRLQWDVSTNAHSGRPRFRSRWWHDTISLPVPIAAAAGLLLIVMAVGLIAIPMLPGRSERTIADLADARIPLNVQVQVGSTESDLLMKWLDEQNEVGHVTIQLPDYGEFRLRGEPVLVRPELESQTTEEEALEFTPMEVLPE